MTLHIIMLATLIIGGLACAWCLHRAYQERRKRQIYAAAHMMQPLGRTTYSIVDGGQVVERFAISPEKETT